jgi:hypothetical protein
MLNFRAMASPLLWLEALAGLKALYDLAQGAVDYAANLQRHRQERDTIAEASRVSAAFSTYSDAEVEAIIRRINGCRDRFISQGGRGSRSMPLQHLQ